MGGERGEGGGGTDNVPGTPPDMIQVSPQHQHPAAVAAMGTYCMCAIPFLSLSPPSSSLLLCSCSLSLPLSLLSLPPPLSPSSLLPSSFLSISRSVLYYICSLYIHVYRYCHCITRFVSEHISSRQGTCIYTCACIFAHHHHYQRVCVIPDSRAP